MACDPPPTGPGLTVKIATICLKFQVHPGNPGWSPPQCLKAVKIAQTVLFNSTHIVFLTTLSFLTTRLRWVHFRSSFGCPPAHGLTLSFCSNAHHHGSLPQQLGVVCDLLLKPVPRGPPSSFTQLHDAVFFFVLPSFPYVSAAH